MHTCIHIHLVLILADEAYDGDQRKMDAQTLTTLLLIRDIQKTKLEQKQKQVHAPHPPPPPVTRIKIRP